MNSSGSQAGRWVLNWVRGGGTIQEGRKKRTHLSNSRKKKKNSDKMVYHSW